MNIKEAWLATRQYVANRKQSYQFTFTWQNRANRNVLIDLAWFCRANESCVVKGDRDAGLVLEGRREVWLRIQQHINLSPEELMVLYTGKGNPDA